MLHSHDNGRLDMNPPTVKMTEENREAVNAVIARLLARKTATASAAPTREGKS